MKNIKLEIFEFNIISINAIFFVKAYISISSMTNVKLFILVKSIPYVHILASVNGVVASAVYVNKSLKLYSFDIHNGIRPYPV